MADSICKEVGQYPNFNYAQFDARLEKKIDDILSDGQVENAEIRSLLEFTASSMNGVKDSDCSQLDRWQKLTLVRHIQDHTKQRFASKLNEQRGIPHQNTILRYVQKWLDEQGYDASCDLAPIPSTQTYNYFPPLFGILGILGGASLALGVATTLGASVVGFMFGATAKSMALEDQNERRQKALASRDSIVVPSEVMIPGRD